MAQAGFSSPLWILGVSAQSGPTTIYAQLVTDTIDALTPGFRKSVPFSVTSPTALARRAILDKIVMGDWFDVFIKLNSREEILWGGDGIGILQEVFVRGQGRDVRSITFNIWKTTASAFLTVSLNDLEYMITMYPILVPNPGHYDTPFGS